MPDAAANTQASASENRSPSGSQNQNEHAVREWLDMLGTGTKLLRAGLRREVGPDGDVDAAFREWYAAQMEEHDRKVRRILERQWEAEKKHAT